MLAKVAASAGEDSVEGLNEDNGFLRLLTLLNIP